MSIMAIIDQITKEQWLKQVSKELKGVPMDQLNWILGNDIHVSPFKDISDLPADLNPLDAKPNNYWSIIEPIIVSQDLSNDNQLILDSLQKGASGLSLYFDSIPTSDHFEELLQGVFINLIPIEIIIPEASGFESAIQSWLQYIRSSEFDDHKVQSFITVDELDIKEMTFPKASLLTQLNENSQQTLGLTINSGQFYKGKDYVTEEIGSTLFVIAKILTHYQGLGQNMSVILHHINIAIDLDDIYLLNIAKIRALKKCFDLIKESFDISHAFHLNIKASVAPIVLTDNLQFNRIKVSAIALSAVIGGVDRLQLFSNGPIDDQEKNEFKRRIARNVSHILALESYMDRVYDPAAGSYYIESLTETIAEKSWKYFQNLWTQNQS
jgi:methylmalonyl-CoA mutase